MKFYHILDYITLSEFYVWKPLLKILIKLFRTKNSDKIVKMKDLIDLEIQNVDEKKNNKISANLSIIILYSLYAMHSR